MAPTLTRAYTGKDPMQAQSMYQMDSSTLVNSDWKVVSTFATDARKGNMAGFIACLLLGFILLIPWFIAPFLFPRGEYTITATYGKDDVR